MLPFLVPLADSKIHLNYKAPITLSLILFISFVYLLSFENSRNFKDYYKTFSQDQKFVDSNFYLYKNYILENSNHPLHKNIKKIETASLYKKKHISFLSFQDNNFKNNPFIFAKKLSDYEKSHWMKNMNQFSFERTKTHTYQYGFLSGKSSLFNRISYLFFHASFFHLFINLLFLFIFGSALERQESSLLTLLMFLGGGFLSTFIYEILNFSDLQYSLIGSSASICAIIGCYVSLNHKSKLIYFYWILPFENYFGLIKLSAYYTALIWLLTDLGGYLASVPWSVNVAYSAHLGGMLVGLLIGFVLRNFRKLFRGIKTSNSLVAHPL